METAQPIAASPYLWPPSVLQALRIGNTDIGVTGSAFPTLNGARREVLVPLRISQRKTPARSSTYRVTVWPSVELSDVFVTVATADSSGKPATYLQRDENLAYGFYPAERGVVVPLKPLAARGIYFVRIAATLKRGGSATSTFCFPPRTDRAGRTMTEDRRDAPPPPPRRRRVQIAGCRPRYSRQR